MSTTSLSSISASATGGASGPSQPASFKVIGVLLAIGSGLFIGSSFVFKKKGLLSAQQRPDFVAGEGHAYLKSPLWWTGMILMVFGEILNFVAYAFTEAVLVTPLGALSVVICAILSSIFLKERLTFFGKIGCGLCIIGATTVALNGPQEQTVTTIEAFQDLFLAPGFLVFGSTIIVAAIGIILFVAPKYGKTNMLVYITVCSIIGGLSVSCTQGLGASILTSIRGDNQFKHPFMYILMAFVVCTLLTEINYLNKALELFNTAMVTPTYYVTFTFSTLLTSVILYQGFKASAIEIVTVVMGFLTICAGITLLQLSKIDPVTIEKNLDRRSTILISAARAEVSTDSPVDEKALALEDPGVDTIRGTFGAIGSIHRAMSQRKLSQRRASMASSRGGSHVGDDSRFRRGHTPKGSDATGEVGMKKFQLYDKPLPADFADKISQYSASSSQPHFPGGVSGGSILGNNRDRSTSITFSPQDTTHRYGYGPSPLAVHDHVYRQDTHDHTYRQDSGPSGLGGRGSNETTHSRKYDGDVADFDKRGDYDFEDGRGVEEDLPPFSAPPQDLEYQRDPFESPKGSKSATIPRGEAPTLVKMLKSQFAASSPDVGNDEGSERSKKNVPKHGAHPPRAPSSRIRGEDDQTELLINKSAENSSDGFEEV